MIYAKTVCKKPGSYVAIVPVGLRVSLQYNQNGLIQSIKMLIDDGDDKVEVDRDYYTAMLKFVPNKIALAGGTTWVEGVFYFADIPTDAGSLPDCCYSTYLARFLKNDCMCEFYAATVTSYAASFVGAQTIRNWLSSNQFKVLPGAVVPIEMTEDTIKLMLQTGAYSFKYPYISGFYTFTNAETEYIPADLRQSTVTAVDTVLSPEGYVQSNVHLDCAPIDATGAQEDIIITLNYSEVCAHSVQEGASILYYVGDYIELLATRSADPAFRLKVVDNHITCPVCGKIYVAPSHGPVQCDDPHCLSTAYPEVCRILEEFELPLISIDDFRQLIVDKKIITATDILCVEPYSEMVIKGDLLKVLIAAAPAVLSNDEAFFTKLLHECNYSVDTLMYYLNNPMKMVTELDLVTVSAKRFVEWCKDEYNVLTVKTLLSAVHIEDTSLHFEGSPIFRGNKFVLTGKFKRGDLSKVTQILEGYAATVLPDFDKEVPTMLITGGTDEGIEGRLVQAARKFNVPVVDEDSFFTHFEIDADLQASHLL